MKNELTWRCVNEKCSNFKQEITEPFRIEQQHLFKSYEDGTYEKEYLHSGIKNAFTERKCSICNEPMELLR